MHALLKQFLNICTSGDTTLQKLNA